MKSIRQFFKDVVEQLFGMDEEPDNAVDVKSYNREELKAGYLHLRDKFSKTDPDRSDADYNFCFSALRIPEQGTKADINEEMIRLVDLMYKNDLLPSDDLDEEYRDTLASLMTNDVVRAIETLPFEQVLMNAIRYDQQLQSASLRVVHNDLSA